MPRAGARLTGIHGALPLGAVAAFGLILGSCAPTNTSVSSFMARPSSFAWFGGSTRLSAKVSNGRECRFSVSSAVKMLPTKRTCSTGTVSEKLTVPMNRGPKAITYTLGLSVTGTKTVKAKATVTIGVAPPLTGVRSLGGNFCARLSTGKVDCWGPNMYGEIGNGTFDGPEADGYDMPQLVHGINNAVFVTSDGEQSNCALLSTGRVDCWGYSGDGQLGNGVIPRRPDGEYGYDTPQLVVGITNAVSINGEGSVGGGYCAVLSTGGVDCWGDNSSGQLGNGTVGGPIDGGYDTPQVVNGVTDAVAVTSTDAYFSSACALLSTGRVDCWGDNLVGELGNGTTGGPDGVKSRDYDMPQQVTGIVNAVSITGAPAGAYLAPDAGPGDYCAVLSTGRVVCWGENQDGILGNGTINGPDGAFGYDTPQTVIGIANAVSVTAELGDEGSGVFLYGYCARLSTGRVDCWGDNGKRGRGTPEPVAGITNAVSVDENCAVLSTGRVDCWRVAGEGRNDEAQPITGITDAVAIDENCAVLSTGGVDCWGGNGEGRNDEAQPVR